MEPLRLPPSSLDLNAFAERWVRSGKEECLSRLILFGEGSLWRALNEYLMYFHAERPDQGKGNRVLFPEPTERGRPGDRTNSRTKRPSQSRTASWVNSNHAAETSRSDFAD